MSSLWHAIMHRLRRRLSREPTRHRVEAERWKGTAQEKEWAFHATNEWRRSSRFTTDNARLWEHFGFTPTKFTGCTIVDFGAGSRLRSRFFEEAKIIAIEPLADRFKALDFCDLYTAFHVYNAPGEERIPSIIDQADLLISINVLDHCFDFDLSISNIAAYLKKEGTAFLSFDLHTEADELHPLLLTEESCTQSFTRAGLSVQKLSYGVGPFGSSYGHGSAINFWLRHGQP